MKGTILLNNTICDKNDCAIIKKNSRGGSPIAPSNPEVRLYDYDGNIKYSYSKSDFLSLGTLPAPPTHDGLTFQGWNYTIEEAKELVLSQGVVNIGAIYATDDGKTRLYITISSIGRMNIPIAFSQTVANGVTIDWGDGSTPQTVDSTGNVEITHAYTAIGNYCISLAVAEGCELGLGHGISGYSVMGAKTYSSDAVSIYLTMLQRVEIGHRTIISNYAFQYCYSLTSIVIPNGVTSIGDYAFYYCHRLASLVIPNSVTSTGHRICDRCNSLASVVMPNSLTSIGGYAFQYCYSLTSIVIPNGVTSIGDYAFYYCHRLASLVIPNSVTSIGVCAFSACYSLASVVMPSSLSSIENRVFYECFSLASVVMPNGVTSIGEYAFNECYPLASIVIPNSVTSIGGRAFGYLTGLRFVDFSTFTAVPSAGYNIFAEAPSDMQIIVPDNLYDEWIAATNWALSSIASKIVKASEFIL